MNNTIEISIVIPVKNGEKYIDSLLKAVFSQEVSYGFEVIIVDSGSKDRTMDIIKQYPAALYQIKPYEFNHGLTRNFGISKAKGKYIVLMTQDAAPYDNHWLIRLVNAINSDENIAGVYSMQIPHSDADALMYMIAARSFTSESKKSESVIKNIEEYRKLAPKERHRFCNFDNVSSCIRKAVWEKFSFPKTDFGEDIEWAKRVLEAGYKIVYEPESIVYHSHDYSISGWYKRNKINYSKLHILFDVNGADSFYKLLLFFFIYTVRDFRNFARFYTFAASGVPSEARGKPHPLGCGWAMAAQYSAQRTPGLNPGGLHWDKKANRAFFSSIPLIPIYSFAGALGQYIGIRQNRYENTSDSA